MAASALNIWAAIDQARRRYQAAGYAVSASEHLEAADRHGAEADIAAYLVARKGEGDDAETRVVEFTPSDRDQKSGARLAALRTVVDGRPGWHLDIVKFGHPSDARPPSHEVVADWIAEARRLVPISPTGAVALARRAVSSALFRLEVARGERYREPPDLSSSLISGLEADGAISADEAETLRGFHAAVATDGSPRDNCLPDEELTEAALEIAERCSAEDAEVVAEMLAWFERHFCTPEQAGVAADSATGDYVWLGTGPYDARAVLRTRFSDSERASLDRAVFLIEQDGLTWARRDSDDAPPAALAVEAELMPADLDAAAGAERFGRMIGAAPGYDGLGLAERHHILQWASRLHAREELPGLVRDLIAETTSAHDLIRNNCPTAEGIGRPDFDLVVESRQGTAWVPAGHSCWEVSTSTGVAHNADANYRKRTGEARLNASEITYVHLTPRAWPEAKATRPTTSGTTGTTSAGASRQQAKRRWQEQRSEDGHWREVRALDVDDLFNWLIQAPATRARLSERLGLVPDGFTSARRRWEHELAQTGGRLAAEVLLAGRERQFHELVERCSTGGGTVYVVAESAQDALDFALAAGARAEIPDLALLDRMLLVSDAAAWRRLKREPGDGAILVAAELDVADGSELSRHCRVIPLVHAAHANTGSREHETLIEVGPIDPTAAAKALERHGLDRSEAWRFATLGRRSMGALRRTLQLGPKPVTPAWLDRLPDDKDRAAVWAALLAGRWSERRVSDQSVLCELAGTGLSYEGLRLMLRPLSEGADPLIARVGDQWAVVAPAEAWRLLVAEIPESVLDRYSEWALRVLTEIETLQSPDGTDLEVAGVKLTQRTYSDELRHGVAQTAALLGTFGIDVPLASGTTPRVLTALIVRGLLGTDDADDGQELGHEGQRPGPASARIESGVRRTFQRIVDLADVLPLLAEAAPDEFLEAIARALQLAREAPDCLQVLDKGSAGPSSDAGWYGLRHALETLAWSPESGHLALVSDVLLAIAAIGNDDLAVKAHGCLVSLFRPWLPQTGLSTDRRNEVLVGLCDRIQSDEAPGTSKRRTALWRCLWDLAPHRSGGSPNAAPTIRDWPAVVEPAPFEDEASATSQVNALLLDMVEHFASSTAESSHLSDMYWPLDEGGKFMRLPPEARARALAIVEEATTQGTLDRSLLGDRLRSFIRLQRRFTDAFWTLEPDELASVEQVAERIGDDDPATTGAWLFESHAPDLDAAEIGDDQEAKEARLAELRRTAVTQAHAACGLEGVRRLAVRAHGDRQVSGVEYIGCVLAVLADSGELTLDGGETTDASALTPTLAGWLSDNAPPEPSVGALDRNAPQTIGPGSDDVPCDLVAMGFFAENLRFLRRVGADLSVWLAGLLEHHLSVTNVARLLTALRDFPLAWEISEALGPDVEAAYWARFDPLPYGLDFTLTAEAAERLLVASRADAAIELLAYQRFAAGDSGETAAIDDSRLIELALRALETMAGAMDSPQMAQRLRFRAEELLDWLSDRLPLTELNLDDPHRVRLARLELMLDDMPGSRRRPSLLHARLSLDPRFFVELVARMYLHPDGSEPGDFDESLEANTTETLAALATSKAWSVLHYWNRTPGTREDGTIDLVRLRDWVNGAIEEFGELDLSRLGCEHIGQVLAKASADPGDSSGIVPPPAVRDFLEELHDSDIELGLAIGIVNQRGVHSHSLMSGGEAERELALRYNEQANIVGDRWPHTAQVLRRVAASCDSHGRMHDIRSEQFARGT